MADDFYKKRGIFDEDRSGFAFREVFTPTREGPLPPRRPGEPRPPGKGGPSINQGAAVVASSVWSAADAAANGMTLSNGGLTVTAVTAAYLTIRSTVGKTSGKLYIEFLANATATDNYTGVASTGFNIGNTLGMSNYSCSWSYGGTQVSTGFTAFYPQASVTLAPGDVIALAIDFGTQNIWIAKNNVWASSSNPATGSLPMFSFVLATVGTLFPAVTIYGGYEVWTIQPTAASQKYAPPAGFSAWDGGVALTPAQAYLARTVGGNEGGNAANITTLIDGLVADGVWAKLDCLYVLAQQNVTDAKLNLIGTNYSLTQDGSTFTTYKGFQGFTTGLNSGFNSTTASSPQFTQNSASLGAWAYNIVNDNGAICGTSQTGTYTAVYDDYGGTAYYAANGPVGGAPMGFPNATGLYCADRSTNTRVDGYFNGASLANNAVAAQTIANAAFYIGAINGGNPTGETISAAFIGASLGASGQLALYNRLRTYMTAVGVP